MLKLKIKNPHTAQGMVEFALVLPVFLMVILGLFAVGHYLFTYSFVLSSSREAARYGAAVGMAESGKLRFQDCDGIIEAASRVGGVAGVNTVNVSISYDRGPDTPSIGTCPPGGTGPNLELGDRILVDVVVPYEPIVPVIIFPTVNVTANTARTIVRDITIGQALDSDDHCVDTTTSLIFTGLNATGPNPSVVGQVVTWKAEVDALGGEADPISSEAILILDIIYEEVEVEVDGVMVPQVLTTETEMCTMNTQNDSCTAQFFEHGVHSITARFNGLAGDVCYNPSETFNYELTVNPAQTVTTINTHYPTKTKDLEPVEIGVSVFAKTPGAGYPTGAVTVSGGESSCIITLDNGIGSCILYPKRPKNGKPVDITALYPGDGNYLTSSDTVQHLVESAYFPPIIPPPDPLVCPVFGPINFYSKELVFTVKNMDDENIHLDALGITWPKTPLAKLQEIRLGQSTSADCGVTNTCVFTSKGESPVYAFLDSGNAGWDVSRSLINTSGAGDPAYEVRLVFSSNLPEGPYDIYVAFSNGCAYDELKATLNP